MNWSKCIMLKKLFSIFDLSNMYVRLGVHDQVDKFKRLKIIKSTLQDWHKTKLKVHFWYTLQYEIFGVCMTSEIATVGCGTEYHGRPSVSVWSTMVQLGHLTFLAPSLAYSFAFDLVPPRSTLCFSTDLLNNSFILNMYMFFLRAFNEKWKNKPCILDTLKLRTNHPRDPWSDY